MTFSLSMSISPGPVNIMILSSAANYGFKKTFAFVSGAAIGFTLLLSFIGFIQIVQAYPFLLRYLGMAGAMFIAYMGYKIMLSKPDINITKNKLPKFYQGFLMQWLNPKAWIACVSGVSLFSSASNYQPLLTFIIIYFMIVYASLFIWSIVGDKMASLISSKTRLIWFNRLMGSALIVTAVYLFILELFQV